MTKTYTVEPAISFVDLIIRHTAWFVWTVVISAVVIILVCGDHIEDSRIT